MSANTDLTRGLKRRVEDVTENALDPQSPAATVSAVLDLHVRGEAQRHFGDRRFVCKTCDNGRSVPVWPCPTVLAIARALGFSSETPRGGGE